MKCIIVDPDTPARCVHWQAVSGIVCYGQAFSHTGHAGCTNLNVSSPRVVIIYQSELKVPAEVRWP